MDDFSLSHNGCVHTLVNNNNSNIMSAKVGQTELINLALKRPETVAIA